MRYLQVKYGLHSGSIKSMLPKFLINEIKPSLDWTSMKAAQNRAPITDFALVKKFFFPTL